jgi:hypothetical protein
MSHEKIIASVIYYYQNSDCLEDSGLAFRAETPYNEDYGPRGRRSWAKSKNLGTIRTPQGRVIVFTNDVIFFLTDIEVATSSNFVEKYFQNGGWNKKNLMFF